ncbi:Integrase, catalytic core [Cucumis melo var. makuwa]|uniref:Integrase, catalytic core n=1 Tax=Cucumis melo var. makuwa TaxID=1194695 RepID=A0A5A7TYC9_CUCMM|nr:Integrase, catalytic core [Cucumis melo var. makuwa]TYK18941.1 Integrase, catalytic core [Cucumis melo var. makuwa]
MTPQEAWDGRKPSVDHFKVFRCIAYAHIPDKKRRKLDDKDTLGKQTILVNLEDSDESLSPQLKDSVQQSVELEATESQTGGISLEEGLALYGLKQAPKAWFQMENCNSAATSVKPNLKLTKDHEGKKVNSTLYKQMVGSLMYLTEAWSYLMVFQKAANCPLSTIEAEFVAATSCACQVIWLRNILQNLHYKQEEASIIHCDNASTIKLTH